MLGDQAPEISVPDVDCQNIGIKAAWGLANQLFVFAGGDTAKHADNQQPTVSGPTHIHEMKWDTDMHAPIARKLVNESHQIFNKLQETGGNVKEGIASSRAYRAVIKACVVELRNLLASCHEEEQKETLEIQLKLFDMIELIWSLCEILFIESLPGGVVLQRLLDWVRLHFVEGSRLASEVMKHEVPEYHQHYWLALQHFVLQGQIDRARQMLSVHSERTTPHHQLMDHLLKSMPMFNPTMQSLNEFEMKFHHWQEQCHQQLEEGAFSMDHQLETICKILVGHDEVFFQLREHIGSWYCMLVCRLLYQNPAVKVLDLQYSTEFCINAYGGLAQMQAWDDILLSALQFDIHQVIKESSASLSNWWFVAHMTDVLHHCGKLECQTLSFGASLREFLLLEYATSLMSHHSLWQVSANYLGQCPEYGHAYLEHFIDHLPIESEKKAQKVLFLCEQRGLHDQSKSICKTMGMKALRNNRLGSALSWSLRSKDVNFATFIAEKFLDEYSERGLFLNLDMIDNLGSSMLLSSKLTFLGKYREFHKLYEDGDFKASAALLLSLLTSQVAPSKFWLTLLLDALPLLETEEVIFSSQDTYELMHCLKQLKPLSDERQQQRMKKQDRGDSGEVSSAQDEKLELMKLALGRNLARAMLQEQSV